MLGDRREAGEGRGPARRTLRQPLEEAGQHGLAPLDVRDERGIHTCFTRCLRDDLLVDELEPEPARDDGAKLLASGDANRADYLKRFYGVSRELPAHYDIALNTDRVSPEDAAALVLSAARSERSPA